MRLGSPRRGSPLESGQRRLAAVLAATRGSITPPHSAAQSTATARQQAAEGGYALLRAGDTAAICAEVRRTGFAVIDAAIDAQQVAEVNAWIDASQRRTPQTWFIPETRGGIYEYFNPLLDETSEALDPYLQLPATAEALDELLGGRAALNQFDYRETLAGSGVMRSGFHHVSPQPTPRPLPPGPGCRSRAAPGHGSGAHVVLRGC